MAAINDPAPWGLAPDGSMRDAMVITFAGQLFWRRARVRWGHKKKSFECDRHLDDADNASWSARRMARACGHDPDTLGEMVGARIRGGFVIVFNRKETAQ